MKALHISMIAALLVILAISAAAAPFLATAVHHACADDTEKTEPTSSPDGSFAYSSGETLFPGIVQEDVTAISVRTPERSFEFRCNAPGDVSVNGRKADAEIFSTLVTQIRELPISAQSAFTARESPMLTLTITTPGAKHTARFYTGGDQGRHALIISGTGDAPQYRRTDVWRIGTLMMTCEGTRIQDERGNEIPAD